MNSNPPKFDGALPVSTSKSATVIWPPVSVKESSKIVQEVTSIGAEPRTEFNAAGKLSTITLAAGPVELSVRPNISPGYGSGDVAGRVSEREAEVIRLR